MSGPFSWLRPKRKYLADAAYWVYIPSEQLPDQKALMDRMIKGDAEAGAPAVVGPQEGLLFSDIRLSVALVLRKKNVHLFRPDLIGAATELTKEKLEMLAEAAALVKIRYLSEDALTDDRHLRLLPHMAVAVGSLAHASLVYDVQTEILWLYKDFAAEVAKRADAAHPELHVRSLWQDLGAGGKVLTRGLAKVGLADFESKVMNSDEKVLVCEVFHEAGTKVFAARAYPESIEVESFGDRFRVVFEQRSKGHVEASIMRVREV